MEGSFVEELFLHGLVNETCHVHDGNHAPKCFDPFKSAAPFITPQHNANLDATSKGAPLASPPKKGGSQQ